MHRVALFALDAVVDRSAAVEEWANEVATANGLGGPASAMLINMHAQAVGPTKGFFTGIKAVFNLATSVDLLWDRYRQRMVESVACPTVSVVALRALRAARWRVGIVASGLSDLQTPVIERTGLSEVVDSWCVADEAGARGMDEAVLQLAAQRCGSTLGDGGWLVTVDQSDLQAGRNAGWRTIWRQPRPGPWSSSGPMPDLVVDSVPEAVQALLSSTETATRH
jgi:FMN phosphatase YigB (HAD superfamily)